MIITSVKIFRNDDIVTSHRLYNNPDVNIPVDKLKDTKEVIKKYCDSLHGVPTTVECGTIDKVEELDEGEALQELLDNITKWALKTK